MGSTASFYAATGTVDDVEVALRRTWPDERVVPLGDQECIGRVRPGARRSHTIGAERTMAGDPVI